MKTKTRKIRGMKRKYNKKTKNAKRGGFTDYLKKYMYSDPAAATPLPSNPELNTTNPEIYTTNQSQTPKKYSSLRSGVTTSLTRSAKAYNMPAILGAISTKINALLIHNKVNYNFSNGFNASDYDIESVAANGDNDGRGILKENAKREEITGLQSKLYNMGTDSYDKYKNKQSNRNTEPNKL